MSTGKWYHLAGVYEKDTLTLYINGFLAGQKPAAFNLTDQRIQLNPDGNFKGKMDELRIWNTGRSQSEIGSFLSDELTGSETGLVVYYNFNEGEPNGDNTALAAEAYDQTGNIHHGGFPNFTQMGITSNWVLGAPVNHLDANADGIGDICAPPLTDFSLTIQVDMRTHTVSPNGVHIAGGFQSEAGFPGDWDPSTTLMTDVNHDGIYEVTLTLDVVEPNHQFRYKFINGNDWPFSEYVPEECGILGGAGAFDRFFHIPEDGSTSLTIDAVCYEICIACEVEDTDCVEY